MAHSLKPIPHGTSTGYKHHGCRCAACKKANSERQKQYRKGLGREYMPAKQVRKHAIKLLQPRPGTPTSGSMAHKYRWTLRTLSDHVGINRTTLNDIVTGRNKKIQKKYGEAILATAPKRYSDRQDEGREYLRWLCEIPEGHYVNEPNAGDYRWTQRLLAAHLGICKRTMTRWLNGHERLPDYRLQLLLATPRRTAFLEMQANFTARRVPLEARRTFVGAAAN